MKWAQYHRIKNTTVKSKVEATRIHAVLERKQTADVHEKTILQNRS